MKKTFVFSCLLFLSSLTYACSVFDKPNPRPTPTPTPQPQVAVLTVQVDPTQAIVSVGEKEFGTRSNGIIEEEFRAGDLYLVSARADGYKPSPPVQIRMTAGRMPTVTIKLERLTPNPTPTPPTPPIPPVFTITNGELPLPVFNLIKQFAATFPLPRDALAVEGQPSSEAWMDSALRFGWIKKLAEQLAFNFGPAWGQKRRGPGSPVSAGSIAMKSTGGMDVWDLLLAASSGRPTLSHDPEHFWVIDQEFLPVAQVDHLSSITPPTDRPTIATPFVGISSFDLAPRVLTGDMRWIDQILDVQRHDQNGVPFKITGRMFMYANGSGGNRLWRDAETGLAQTENLLKLFVQRGLSGQFVILCGTGNDGWSRAQSLNYVSRANALFLRFPSAVKGLAIFNENSHGIEADYATDPVFLAEAESLIDKRFPVTWGAGHGGEGVFSAGGSYLVHHGDRSLTPERNGEIMGEAQVAAKRPVIDDENLGITEVGRTAGRQRTDDPEFARRQIRAVRNNGLGGSTLHIDAGLTCNVDELGPVQLAAIAIYAGGLEHYEDEYYQEAA